MCYQQNFTFYTLHDTLWVSMPDLYTANTKSAQGKKPEQPRRNGPSTPPPDYHNVPGHTHNPFAAFYFWPDKVKFETQEHEEKIVLLLRQHVITNIPWVLMTVLLFFAPLLLDYIPLLSFLPEKLQYVAVIFWYLIVTAFALEQSLSWFFNVYIITDERVIDVDFYNLIYKEISDTKLDKIQDVTYTMGGVIRTFFDYGDVMIQTAGTVNNFEFLAVPNPAEVSKILQELRTEEEQEALEGRVR